MSEGVSENLELTSSFWNSCSEKFEMQDAILLNLLNGNQRNMGEDRQRSVVERQREGLNQVLGYLLRVDGVKLDEYFPSPLVFYSAQQLLETDSMRSSVEMMKDQGRLPDDYDLASRVIERLEEAEQQASMRRLTLAAEIAGEEGDHINELFLRMLTLSVEGLTREKRDEVINQAVFGE